MCSDNNSTDVTLTENPSCRYALHDVICDLTIEELESVVGYMQDVEGVLQSSPFPHVEIDTDYGEVIIYDSALGWQNGNIEIVTISVRCVFDQRVAIKTDSLANVFEPENIDVSVSSDGRSTVIKSELALHGNMRTIDLLKVLSTLLKCFDRFYSLSVQPQNK